MCKKYKKGSAKLGETKSKPEMIQVLDSKCNVPEISVASFQHCS